MLTKEILEEKGFVFESLENGLFQHYKKKIDENVDLVVEVAPEQTIFVWIADEDAEDRENEGVRVILDVEDIDFAIKCAGAIVGVE